MNFDPADSYRAAEFHETHIGVTDTRIQAEKLKPESTDLVEVPGTTAGDMADAAEFLMNRRGDLAELGAQARRVVEIFAHRNEGCRLRRDVAQVIAQQVDRSFIGPWFGSPGLRRHRIADDRAQVGKQTANRMRQKSGVPRPSS